MVDLALLQSVSYMAGALGVFIAAIFYVLNLRISQRNMRLTLETRRLSLIENIASHVTDEEGEKRMQELSNYEWTDYADFNRKYGSENNVGASAKRYALWHDYNKIGMMLRKGLVDVEDLYMLGLWAVSLFWEKYKPIVEETRRRYAGKDYLKDMEYLAAEITKYQQLIDPSYSIPKKLDRFDPDL
jgi:hypothetical protein